MIARVTTGSPQLDVVLGGGLPEHSIVLVAGAPGTGKTILAEQFAFANGTPARPALYLTTANEPLDKVVRFGQQFDFFDAQGVGSRVIYESLAELLALEAMSPVLDRIVSLVTTIRPGTLVIDSLRALEVYASGPIEHRRFLTELAHRLSAMAITTLWVGEYEDEILTTPEAAIADAIIRLRSAQADQRSLRYAQVLKLRGGPFLSGEHAYRLSASGIHVFPRLADPLDEAGDAGTVERISLGGDGLDDMISGGVWRGTTTLVMGPSGAGKTMLGLEFLAQGVRDGRRGVLATLQEGRTQIRRARTDRLPASDDGILFHHRSPVDVYIDEWVLELFEVLDAHAAELLLIDSLSDLRMAAVDEKRFEEYVYSLAQRCARRGVTALMTLEATPVFALSAVAGTAISNLSDNILLLGYHLSEGMVQPTIHVLKSRGSAHDPRVRELHVDGSGVRVGELVRVSTGAMPEAGTPSGHSA